MRIQFVHEVKESFFSGIRLLEGDFTCCSPRTERLHTASHLARRAAKHKLGSAGREGHPRVKGRKTGIPTLPDPAGTRGGERGEPMRSSGEAHEGTSSLPTWTHRSLLSSLLFLLASFFLLFFGPGLSAPLALLRSLKGISRPSPGANKPDVQKRIIGFSSASETKRIRATGLRRAFGPKYD